MVRRDGGARRGRAAEPGVHHGRPLLPGPGHPAGRRLVRAPRARDPARGPGDGRARPPAPGHRVLLRAAGRPALRARGAPRPGPQARPPVRCRPRPPALRGAPEPKPCLLLLRGDRAGRPDDSGLPTAAGEEGHPQVQHLRGAPGWQLACLRVCGVPGDGAPAVAVERAQVVCRRLRAGRRGPQLCRLLQTRAPGRGEGPAPPGLGAAAAGPGADPPRRPRAPGRLGGCGPGAAAPRPALPGGGAQEGEEVAAAPGAGVPVPEPGGVPGAGRRRDRPCAGGAAPGLPPARLPVLAGRGPAPGARKVCRLRPRGQPLVAGRKASPRRAVQPAGLLPGGAAAGVPRPCPWPWPRPCPWPCPCLCPFLCPGPAPCPCRWPRPCPRPCPCLCPGPAPCLCPGPGPAPTPCPCPCRSRWPRPCVSLRTRTWPVAQGTLPWRRPRCRERKESTITRASLLCILLQPSPGRAIATSLQGRSPLGTRGLCWPSGACQHGPRVLSAQSPCWSGGCTGASTGAERPACVLLAHRDRPGVLLGIETRPACSWAQRPARVLLGIETRPACSWPTETGPACSWRTETGPACSWRTETGPACSWCTETRPRAPGP